jgi:cysteine-rich repeat protein
MTKTASPVTLLALLAACTASLPGEELPGSTGTEEISSSSQGEGSSSEVDPEGTSSSGGDPMDSSSSSTGEDPSSSGGLGSSTGEPMELPMTSTGDEPLPEGSSSSTGDPVPDPVYECGNYIVEPGEQCDVWKAPTAMCDADCTWAKCGDGVLNPAAGELCDDGNTVDGDGCKGDCTRYDIQGVAKGVPWDALVGFKLCFQDSYSDGGWTAHVFQDFFGPCLDVKNKTLIYACAHDEINGGDPVMELVFMAPRADTMVNVDYYNGERHQANGISWGYAPSTKKIMGFAPGGNVTACMTAGQDEQMCWNMGWGGQQNTLVFGAGGRCGSKTTFAPNEAHAWRQYVFVSAT